MVMNLMSLLKLFPGMIVVVSQKFIYKEIQKMKNLRPELVASCCVTNHEGGVLG